MKVVDIINEELLKFKEGLGDKFAAKLGVVDDDYMDTVIKNPQSLIDFVPDTRAIIDENGNVYVSKENHLTHSQMAEYAKLTTVNEFHYYKDRIVSLFRIENTNNFGLNIFSFNYMSADRINSEKVLNILNKAKQQNPQFKYLAKLYDPENEED